MNPDLVLSEEAKSKRFRKMMKRKKKKERATKSDEEGAHCATPMRS